MKKIKNRLKTTLKILAAAAVVSVLSAAAVNAAMVVKTRPRIEDIDGITMPAADCILVLGAGVRADGSPSHMLTDRLIVGIKLYRQGTAPKLLMSGDHG